MENKYIEDQKEICIKYSQDFFRTSLDLKIGISDNFNSGEMPLNGLRHFPEGDTSGWYIWAGEYSESEDFFKPIHIFHLLESFPEIVKYLGLPPGNRFLMDNKGYEDVWFDEGLLVYDTQRS
ncbi:hypothetical protein D3C87_1234060 [compost metagenome]